MLETRSALLNCAGYFSAALVAANVRDHGTSPCHHPPVTLYDLASASLSLQRVLLVNMAFEGNLVPQS